MRFAPQELDGPAPLDATSRVAKDVRLTPALRQ